MVISDPKYDIPRNFEGYGEHSLHPHWPSNAKLALSFILNYEEGGERSTLSGDGQSEPYLWEKGASSSYVPSGRHNGAESEFEYGSRAGSWRILRLFKEQGYKFTTWAVSQAITSNPTFARALVREGHEIAAHGARWLDILDYSVEEEKEYIKKNCLELEAVTGVFPRGYFFGRATFDMLLREGRGTDAFPGSPKLMNIPLHTRIIGKPGRSEALREFMLYVKEKGGDDVWVATREEIATHFKSVYPYKPGELGGGIKGGLD
ncbi:putative Chitin deacetylase 1 [Glarea lozoyensis 74030]|uniref:Putative Chitin deacetylase 1 n=1 Tax=Glarea lozoyensis (strain ATCC 74030 / MF5533) TaxID=1104152 RepID=H0EWA6_GLAL7|nr:putative Chitin deacetylase 1 [Glarea lozoyensis 74030]